MTFAAETIKQTTHRFMLVRLKPRRCLLDYLTDQGSGLFSGNIGSGFSVDAVYYQSDLCTATTANPVTVDYTYNYNRDTGAFQIKLDPADDESLVFMDYSLYLSSRETGVVAYSDPVAMTGSLVNWEPRLKADPEVSSSISNNQFGVFTLSSNGVEIQNADRWFTTYLTKNDSYLSRPVDIWMCLGDVTRIKKIFTGKINALSANPEGVSLEILDAFSALQTSAFFGDADFECVYSRRTDFQGSVDPTKFGQPCRMIVGPYSRYKTRPFSTASLANWSELDPEHLEEAVCTSYNTRIGGTRNRAWTICRTLDGIDLPTITSRTVGLSGTSTSFAGTTIAWIQFDFTETNWEAMNFKIGATARIGSDYCRLVAISGVGTGTITSTWLNNSSTSFGVVTSLTSWTLHHHIELVIVDSSGNAYYPMAGRDFALASTVTTAGNASHYITFVNNFETGTYDGQNIFGDDIVNGLDPGKHRVFFRIQPQTDNAPHGAFLSKICEGAGLTVNTASFTAADASFVSDVLLSVPLCDETDYGDYLRYAEAVLAGTLGYLSVNQDDEVVYGLIDDAATASDKTFNTIKRDSATTEYDYKDIVYSIQAENPHGFIDDDYDNLMSATGSRDRALYLHGVSKTDQMTHYLADMVDRLSDHLELRQDPVRYFTWATEAEDLTTSLGDEFTLETDLVAEGSVTVKVVSIDIGADGVKVKAIQTE